MNSIEALERQLCSEADEYQVMLLVDIDGMTQINRKCGHIAGDNLLKGICSLLSRLFGSQSWYGPISDEFVVIVSAENVEAMRDRCQVLLQEVANISLQGDCDALVPTVSLSLGIIPQFEINASEMLAHLRLLMFRVKQVGGNCIGILPEVSEDL